YNPGVGGYRGGYADNRGWRGRQWHGNRGGYYRGYGYGLGGLGLGLAAGSYYGGYGGYYNDPYYYGGYGAYAPAGYGYAEQPVETYGSSGAEDVAYCQRRFRSYDVRSGTYLAKNGRRVACP
ncbi:BA14K family protein, partial [Methylobacterium sp. CG09_land_8_20_14_0_10_71_15]